MVEDAYQRGVYGEVGSDEARKAAIEAHRKMLDAWTENQRKGSSTQVTINQGGPLEPDKVTKRKLQEDVIAARDALQELDAIDRLDQPGQPGFSELVGVGNKIERGIDRIRQALTEAGVPGVELDKRAQQILAEQKFLDNQVQFVIDQVRKTTTGAQASFAELQRLQARLGTSLTVPEFRAALRSFREKSQRILNLRLQMLEEGSINPGSPRFGRELDRRFVEDSKASFLKRANELVKQGLSKKDAAQQARSEFPEAF
jgi:hypothetical protein